MVVIGKNIFQLCRRDFIRKRCATNIPMFRYFGSRRLSTILGTNLSSTQSDHCHGKSFLPCNLALVGALCLFFSEFKSPEHTFCDAKDTSGDEEHDEEEPIAWGRGDKSLKQIMDEHHYEGKDNWPWVWCHRNENGPLYVFSGVDKDTLWKCQQIAAASPNNNLLLIASQQHIEQYGATVEDFYKCRCGVHPGPIAELDLCNKILMLEDERVVEFDHLQIV